MTSRESEIPPPSLPPRAPPHGEYSPGLLIELSPYGGALGFAPEDAGGFVVDVVVAVAGRIECAVGLCWWWCLTRRWGNRCGRTAAARGPKSADQPGEKEVNVTCVVCGCVIAGGGGSATAGVTGREQTKYFWSRAATAAAATHHCHTPSLPLPARPARPPAPAPVTPAVADPPPPAITHPHTTRTVSFDFGPSSRAEMTRTDGRKGRNYSPLTSAKVASNTSNTAGTDRGIIFVGVEP